MMATPTTKAFQEHNGEVNIIPLNPLVEASTSDPEVSNKLYEYTKAFVASAEKALKELDEASTEAKVIAQCLTVIPGIAKVAGVPASVFIPGKQLGDGVRYLSKEIFQKINKSKVFASLRTDSSDSSANIKEVFKRLFVSTAIETYYAFELQLEKVYLSVGDKKDNSSALQILGAFAGERCFDQLLRTGSPENLHRILVPSISNDKGYKFDRKPKTTWKSLKHTAEAKITKSTSFFKTKLTYELRLSVAGETDSKRTAASFFDKCFPGFDPNIPKIKSQLKGTKPSLSEIVVDKIKKGKIKDKTKVKEYYYIRSPFKIEAEKIKADNLEKLNIDPSVFDRRPSDFTYKDISKLAEKIFRKMKSDQPEDINNLISKVESMLSVIQDIDSTTKRTDSTTERTESKVDELLRIASKTEENNAKFKQDLVHEKRSENKFPRRVWFQVQDLPESFVGREVILKQIEKNIKEDEPGAQLTIHSRTHVISGLGGVGKTTIAYKFIRIFEQNYPGSNVVFIHSETQESLKESFVNLALECKIISAKKGFDWERTKIKVYERICDRKCLIVFDNAESLENEKPFNNGIKKFLPSLPGNLIKNLSILVTTRNSKLASWGDREPISLDVFEPNEAVHFVNVSLGNNQKNRKDIEDLCNLCGNLPLALKLTVTFIKQNNNKLFKSGYTMGQFLAEEKIKNLVGNDPENILYRTWDLSMAEISKLPKGELTLSILSVMAFNKMPDTMNLKFFTKFYFKDETEESFGEAIGLLVKYSLISKINDPEKSTCYSIHRIIQMVTKERLKENIEMSSKFLINLASRANAYESETISIYFISDLIHTLFDCVSNDWNNENAWNFAQNVVRTIMGKENVDCDLSLMSRVHDVTMNYFKQMDHVDPSHNSKEEKQFCMFPMGLKVENRVFWNFPECLTGNSSSDSNLLKDCDKAIQNTIASTNYRLVFLASEKWRDFQQKSNALSPSKKTILKKAEDYFAKKGGDSSKILSPMVEGSKVLLLVFIEKVQAPSDSGVWVINPRDKDVPQELRQCDWDGSESQNLFLLLPSEYFVAFSFLLRIIYSGNYRLDSTFIMSYLIGLNMLVSIVSKGKFPNEIGIIQSLIGFIGKGKPLFANQKSLCVVSSYNNAIDFHVDMFEKRNMRFSVDSNKFIKPFVDSAEEALKSLQEDLGEAASVSLLLNATSNDGTPDAVTTPNQEIWQKLNTCKTKNCISIDFSEKFQRVFQEAFVNAASEILNAYMLQLTYVFCFKSTIGRHSNDMALEMLGKYAGKRCFQQFLKTGSFENLHLILVPSIRRCTGYSFEEEGKANWGTNQNIIDKKIIEIETSANEIFKHGSLYFFEKDELEYNETADNFFETDELESIGTVGNFFDDCIPAFYPHIPEIKCKLKEQNLEWTSESYAVDKTQLSKINCKSNKFCFLRLPFKIEAEKIRAENLEILENGISLTDTLPGQFMYPNLDLDNVVDKILNNSKGELVSLALKFLVFFPEDMEAETFKKIFDRGETLESLIEVFELLVENCLIGKHETYYYVNQRVQTFQIRVLGSIDDSLKFFFYLASILNCNLEINFYFILICVKNMFILMSLNWNDQDAWNFAMEIVGTIMGKEHLDSPSSLILMPIVYGIVTKYSKRCYRHKKIPRNLYYTPVKKRLLFLISETFEDFKRQATDICLSKETVEESKNYFTGTQDTTSDSKCDKGLLTVFIVNVENSFDSGVCIFTPDSRGKEEFSKFISNYYWEDEDLQRAFFLLPSQYCTIFVLLLRFLFDVPVHEQFKVVHFIGSIILAKIVLSTGDPNVIDTIHSLLALMGFNCEDSDELSDNDFAEEIASHLDSVVN